MTKKLFYITILIFKMIPLWAQQDAHYSQYMYNKVFLNPASAGSRPMAQLAFFNRAQWTGFEGAPQVTSATLDAPVSYQRFGIAGVFLKENVGIEEKTQASLSVSYKINVWNGFLAMGINGGIYHTNYNLSKLNRGSTPDPAADELYKGKNTTPDLGAGLYLSQEKFYLGLSSTHLNQQNVFEDNESLSYIVKRHYYLMGGYKFRLSEKLHVIPSTIIKHLEGELTQLEISAQFQHDELLWIGASYRTINEVSFQAGFNLKNVLPIFQNDFLIGYAYDLPVAGLNGIVSGSHEIMINYRFKIHKAPNKIKPNRISISPVFF